MYVRLPILLSTLAIAISLFTVAFTSYQQFFKGPSLKIVLSDRIRTWLDPRGKLVINVVVTVLNGGARYGVLTRIAGEFGARGQPTRIPIDWVMFIEHANVGEEGKRFAPHGSFAGWADQLVIPARQAISKEIQFISREPFELKAGHYELRLQGYVGDKPVTKGKAVFDTELSGKAIARLENCRADPETKVAKESVMLLRGELHGA